MKKLLYLLLCIISINAPAQYAGGKIKIYFNRPVDNALATNYPAVFLNQTWADTLCAYINRAKYTIDVAQYDYSYTTTVANIATAINNAYSRGVVVRWIYNGSSTNSALTYLNSNIHTLASPTSSSYNIMHDKFVIIDANSSNASDAIAWTGSNDWSQEMVDSDYNNIIIFQDQPLAQAYTAQFNQMWGGSGATPVTANEKFGPFKTDLGPHIFTIGGSTVELYFSPKDSSNAHILDAINSANSQLYFGVYEMTETSDANAIMARKNAGVSVAGCVDQYDSTTGGTAFTTLRTGLGSNLKVYAQPWSIYHNKYLIVDPCNTASDPLVLTGSHNWTTSADTKNDENVVIIHNADVANIYYQSFYANFTQFNGTLTACTVSNPCAGAVTATTHVNSNVKCYGQSTGSATVNAHGQHGPFTYTWSSSPVQTDSVLSNVAAGTYTVTVKDANACTTTATITITQPSAVLGVSVTETNVACYGASTGTATATVSGGTTNYQYKWSSTPQQTTATASNLPATSYTVTITDANSCTATASTTISQPLAALSVSVTETNLSCNGSGNGTATATVSGGTSTYQYKWNSTPQQTTATASTLPAATYTVTITDSHSCTVTASTTVSQPAVISASGTVTEVACLNGKTGKIVVTASGGSGSYQYLWSTTPQQTTATASNLAAGSYTITVTDSHNCTGTASFSVTQPASGISLTTGEVNATCGNSNGSASVTVSPTGSYTYSWSGGGAAATDANVQAGSYTVTVTATTGGCTATASVQVNSTGGPTVTAYHTNTTCGLNNGSTYVTVSGGTSPYTYTWSNSSTDSAITNLAANVYSVTVKDAHGCESISSVTVTASNGVALNTSSTGTTCGLNNGSAQVTVSNPNNPVYSWNNSGTTATINNIGSGTYTVTVINAGCSATASVSVAASSGVILNTSSTAAACGGSNGSASVSVTNPSNPVYNWSNNATTATLGSLTTGIYTVTVTNGGTCSASASVTVGTGPGTTSISVTPDRTNVCFGDSAHLCAGSGYSTYLWSNSAGGVCIYADQSGSYSVTATDASGCTATSTPTVITVYPANPASFSIVGTTLTANGGVSYQWMLNGTAISGAVAQVWTATQSGEYSVQVTDSNGCTTTSSQQMVTVNGIDDLSSSEFVKVYPNPLTGDSWQLSVGSDWAESTLEIYDAAGKPIYRTEIRSSRSELSPVLPQGVYMLKITANGKSIIKKLIRL